MMRSTTEFVAPLVVAPAMKGKMWLNPALQENVVRLKSRGALLIARARVRMPAATRAPGDFGKSRESSKRSKKFSLSFDAKSPRRKIFLEKMQNRKKRLTHFGSKLIHTR
jgi:phosphopantothenoylcysteine synthetase/decarboxylase